MQLCDLLREAINSLHSPRPDAALLMSPDNSIFRLTFIRLAGYWLVNKTRPLSYGAQ